MNRIIERHYHERFMRLPESIQNAIQKELDNGAAIISSFNITLGKCVCAFGSDDPVYIWEDSISESELTILAMDAHEILSTFSIDRQQQIGSDLDNGASVVINFDHATGKSSLHLCLDGKDRFIGEWANKETSH